MMSDTHAHAVKYLAAYIQRRRAAVAFTVAARPASPGSAQQGDREPPRADPERHLGERASARASACTAPGAEVHTSNHASMSSRVPAAAAARLALISARPSSAAVASAATASAPSRPAQASDQDAPPGARLMQLRMFYLPDEPAD
jgi:hypothetical protein